MIHYKKICWRRSSDSAAVMFNKLNFLYYIVKNTGLLEVSCCKNVHLPVYFYICLLTRSFWALEKRQLNKLRRQCADWTHNLYDRVWWNNFCFSYLSWLVSTARWILDFYHPFSIILLPASGLADSLVSFLCSSKTEARRG